MKSNHQDQRDPMHEQVIKLAMREQVIKMAQAGFLPALEVNVGDFVEHVTNSAAGYSKLATSEQNLARLSLPGDEKLRLLTALSWEALGQETAIPVRLGEAAPAYRFHHGVKIENRTQTGNYENYYTQVRSALLKEVGPAETPEVIPDLVLVDSVLVTQMHEEKLLIPIRGLLRADVVAEWQLNDPFLALGFERTQDWMVTLPLTRNFHIPAWSYDLYRPKISATLKAGDLDALIDRNRLAKDQVNGMRNRKWSSAPASDPLCIASMNGLPMIPMQLAASAHAAYSAFAYFSGLDGEGAAGSLLRLKRDKLETPPADAIRERLRSFLTLVFFYAPVGSLFLDQVRAGALRELHFDDWFDPCLPIEAKAFQKSPFVSGADDVSEHRGPMKFKGSVLSCLGGYTLGVAARSNTKIASALLAHQLSKEYSTQWQRRTSGVPIGALRAAAVRPRISDWPSHEVRIGKWIRESVALVTALRAAVLTGGSDDELLHERPVSLEEFSNLKTLKVIETQLSERFAALDRAFAYETKSIDPSAYSTLISDARVNRALEPAAKTGTQWIDYFAATFANSFAAEVLPRA